MRVQAARAAAAVNLERLAAALGMPFSVLMRLVLATLHGPQVKRGAPLAGPFAFGARAA